MEKLEVLKLMKTYSDILSIYIDTTITDIATNNGAIGKDEDAILRIAKELNNRITIYKNIKEK